MVVNSNHVEKDAKLCEDGERIFPKFLGDNKSGPETYRLRIDPFFWGVLSGFPGGVLDLKGFLSNEKSKKVQITSSSLAPFPGIS